MYTISAVVVTYNRKELLIECIDALLVQEYAVTEIIVVDNASSDVTDSLLKEKGYLDEGKRIKYIRLAENRGGAGGFAAGMKEAVKTGTDFIWVMDDDAEPEKDCLKILVGQLEKHPEAKAVAPLKVLPDGRPLLGHRGTIDFENMFSNVIHPLTEDELVKSKGAPVHIDHSSFVGLMVSRDIVTTIGYPDEKLFIYYDDLEYNVRISGKFRMLLIPGSRIVHKERPVTDSGGKDRKRFLIFTSDRKIKYKDLWRTYYSVRNRLYLAKNYQTKRGALLMNVSSYILRSGMGIVLFDDHKLTRLRMLALSVLHGLTGKLGKTVDPQEWTGKTK